jgi:hypothetical protein
MKDKELREVYLNTAYRTTESPFLSILPLQKNPTLDEFLLSQGQASWAFITAFNPQSRLLSLRENRLRNQKLEKDLVCLGLHFRSGIGEGKEGDWPAEESYLILGLTLVQAMDLGRTYDQKAILFGKRNEKAELVFIP